MRAPFDFFDRSSGKCVLWCPQGVVYYRVIIHVDWATDMKAETDQEKKKSNIDINNNKVGLSSQFTCTYVYTGQAREELVLE